MWWAGSSKAPRERHGSTPNDSRTVRDVPPNTVLSMAKDPGKRIKDYSHARFHAAKAFRLPRCRLVRTLAPERLDYEVAFPCGIRALVIPSWSSETKLRGLFKFQRFRGLPSRVQAPVRRGWGQNGLKDLFIFGWFRSGRSTSRTYHTIWPGRQRTGHLHAEQSKSRDLRDVNPVHYPRFDEGGTRVVEYRSNAFERTEVDSIAD